MKQMCQAAVELVSSTDDEVLRSVAMQTVINSHSELKRTGSTNTVVSAVTPSLKEHPANGAQSEADV